MNRLFTARVATAIVTCVLLTLQSGTSSGQLSLPAVPGVRNALPADELARDVNAELPRIADVVDARRLHVNELLRAHRAELERDPHGNVIVRAEVVALAPTADALQKARSAGFVVARQ